MIKRIWLFPAHKATITFPKLSTARPHGLPIVAPVPVPSWSLPPPPPANEVTTPEDVTLRTLLLAESATNTFPELSTAMPIGRLKDALVIAPSANAAEPPPASVVTTPVEDTLRMRLLPVSATNTLPALSTAIPSGLLNVAAEAFPLADPPTPLPATVVTTPAEVTIRMT